MPAKKKPAAPRFAIFQAGDAIIPGTAAALPSRERGRWGGSPGAIRTRLSAALASRGEASTPNSLFRDLPRSPGLDREWSRVPAVSYRCIPLVRIDQTGTQHLGGLRGSVSEVFDLALTASSTTGR